MASRCGWHKIILVSLAWLVWAGHPGVAPAASPKLLITPEQIDIGAFFEGTQVQITGEIPTGSQAVLEIVGGTKAEHLMRKGRRLGLWMNVGEIEVHEAPSLYLAAATDPRLLSSSGNGPAWGFAALKKRVRFSGQIQAQEKDQLFQQFLALKESEELYDTSGKPQVISGSAQGTLLVRTNFWLPGRIQPGTYRVGLSIISPGGKVTQTWAVLPVKAVGFPALLASLAYQHEALYGILAVIIAIVTGYIMGLIFGGKGGH
ncbi:MAG: TIGR02186 family protein [Thermodesulfobacteriota bacterium]